MGKREREEGAGAGRYLTTGGYTVSKYTEYLLWLGCQAVSKTTESGAPGFHLAADLNPLKIVLGLYS